MKLLSDFDGVFTTPEGEAASCAAVLDEMVADDPALERLRREVRQAPHEHGWIVGNAISAFADEDPYIFNNGVVAALYQRGPESVLARLKPMFPRYSDLSIYCFEEGTRRYRSAHASHAEEQALERVGDWLHRGHQVVIVSNSKTDRIETILRSAGFEPGRAGLSVRGNALKFRLGDDLIQVPEAGLFGDRAVKLRRPNFYEIIESEQPNALIGDVLSLDLALPHALRKNTPKFASLRIILRRRDYTPPWALAACDSNGIEVAAEFPSAP